MGDPIGLADPKIKKVCVTDNNMLNDQRGGVCYFPTPVSKIYRDNDTGLMDPSERNFGIIESLVMTVTATFVDGAFFMELSSIIDIHSNMEALYEQLQEIIITQQKD